MDIDFPSFPSSFFNEEDCIIENTFDVLPHMVFQVIVLILDVVFLKVIGTIVCSTVDYMSDAKLLESSIVLSNEVTA